eukprot:4469105-Pyramimonas_sp.AAC.1
MQRQGRSFCRLSGPRPSGDGATRVGSVLLAQRHLSCVVDGSRPAHVSRELVVQGDSNDPLLVFGDASGGPESRNPRLRRVGIGIAVRNCFSPCHVSASLRAPLPGRARTVSRGELLAL